MWSSEQGTRGEKDGDVSGVAADLSWKIKMNFFFFKDFAFIHHHYKNSQVLEVCNCRECIQNRLSAKRVLITASTHTYTHTHTLTLFLWATRNRKVWVWRPTFTSTGCYFPNSMFNEPPLQVPPLWEHSYLGRRLNRRCGCVCSVAQPCPTLQPCGL